MDSFVLGGTMALYLDIPQHEWSEAEALGAVKADDSDRHLVVSVADYSLYKKWLYRDFESGLIILDHYYLVIGEQKCHKCSNITTVVGASYDTFIQFTDPEVYSVEPGEDFQLVFMMSGVTSCSSFVPEGIHPYLEVEYGLTVSYSKTAGESYLANLCMHCDTIQGDFYLFNELGSPFVCITPVMARKLTLLKVNIDRDFIIGGDICWDSGADNMRNFTPMENLFDYEWKNVMSPKLENAATNQLPIQGRLFNLNVPYDEKDEAKAYGAKWDPDSKVWYVPNTIFNVEVFRKWMT
jgi:hypothetical protein